MNFICKGKSISSINDKYVHFVSSHSVKACFEDAISCVDNPHVYLENKFGRHDSEIILEPRDDGKYTMIDELFKQFVPSEKWASVAITGKDGKPFYIKDKELRYQIIMRCESSIVGIQGNNHILNKIIDDLSERPKCKADESYDEWNKRYEKWLYWWGAKNHVLDTEVFNVSLFSDSYVRGCTSFVNPKNGKVGLLTNCRWSHESIESCREELEWICDEICDEENNLEFYVSFFDKDINYYGKYKDKFENPRFTFKLSHMGIELVPRIPIRKMKWVFKCNQNIHGKEWKKVYFLWKIKKMFRNIQKKFFYDDWVKWHEYVLFKGLNAFVNLSERYYTVDEIIRMIQMWKDWYCDKKED